MPISTKPKELPKPDLLAFRLHVAEVETRRLLAQIDQDLRKLHRLEELSRGYLPIFMSP